MAEEGDDGHLVGNAEGGGRAPLGGQGDGLRVRGADEGGAAQTLEDAAGAGGRLCGSGIGRSDGTEGRCHVDEAARRRKER